MRPKTIRHLISLEFTRHGFSMTRAPKAKGSATYTVTDRLNGRQGKIRIKTIRYSRQAIGEVDPVAFVGADYGQAGNVSTIILCYDDAVKIGNVPAALANTAHGGIYRSLFVLTPAELDWCSDNNITSGQIRGATLMIRGAAPMSEERLFLSLETAVDTPFADAIGLLRGVMTAPDYQRLDA